MPFAQSSSAADLESTSSQFFSIADSATLKPTGNFTIEAWIKLESIPATEAEIFASWVDDGIAYAGILFRVNSDGTVSLFSGKNTGLTYGTDFKGHTSTTVLSTGVWYHVAGVYDGSKLRVYINGTEEGTGTDWTNGAVYKATNYVRIGDQRYGGTTEMFFLDGIIDDVRLWSVVRTATEIANNRSVELAGSESNLNAYWPFETALGGTNFSQSLSDTITISDSLSKNAVGKILADTI
ncbi:MAG: LamG domain-containing protein, partial [Candidatus Scalindua sp.]|nr:LamG domain-containing protein [Candidatus Scalindua sp.]